MEERVYRSRIGLGIVFPVYGILTLVCALMAFDGFWLGWALILPVIVFVTHLLFTTHYTIRKDQLFVRSGFFYRKAIDIMQIKKIRDTSSVLSAPAASVAGRIEVWFNRRETIVISPAEKREFILHLTKVNPAIAVKANL